MYRLQSQLWAHCWPFLVSRVLKSVLADPGSHRPASTQSALRACHMHDRHHKRSMHSKDCDTCDASCSQQRQLFSELLGFALHNLEKDLW